MVLWHRRTSESLFDYTSGRLAFPWDLRMMPNPENCQNHQNNLENQNFFHINFKQNIWASTRVNLSSVYATLYVSFQSAQQQRLARILKFAYGKYIYHTLKKANNKGADQTAWMCRLVCTFVVCMQPKSGFLTRSIYIIHLLI